jgi:hypothetical protein
VERDGLPVVMIVPVEGRLANEQYFVELSRRLGRAAYRQGLTEEQLLRELEEDRRALSGDLRCHSPGLRYGCFWTPS